MKYTTETIQRTPFVCYLKHADCNVNDITKKQIIENKLPVFVNEINNCDYYSNLSEYYLLEEILKNDGDNEINCIRYKDFVEQYQNIIPDYIDNYRTERFRIYVGEIDKIISIDEFMKTL